MEKFIIMPYGSLEPDATGLIPANCPLDPIDVGPFPNMTAKEHFRTDMLYRQLPFEEQVNVTDLLGSLFDLASAYRRYWDMRLAGECHSIALALASRRFPGVKTDSIFNEGQFSGDSGKNGREQLWLKEQAESRGVSTNGKWYSKGLARYPGDPKAWVDGMSDVRRIAAENNMTVHGYVEQKGREVAPMPDIAIDPKLVAAEAREIVAEHPGARYEEVYEQVHEVRTGRVDPHPLRVAE